MNLKSKNTHRQLSSSDEKQLEQLLNKEYRRSEFTSMCYSYPMNDNRLLLEYVINFYDNGERTQFFRKAYKKNNEWRLSNDFKVVQYLSGETDTEVGSVEQIISNYMGD